MRKKSLKVFAVLFQSALGLVPYSAAVCCRPAIEFRDVTGEAGLARHLENWELGHGGAWGDATGNGYPDLYIGAFTDRPVYGEPDAPIPNMLFLNDGGKFELSPDEGVRLDGERARTSMSLFADLNNNGRLDLLVGTHGAGPDHRIFENRLPGEFRDVTPGWPRRLEMRNATAIDLERNGLLDLIFFDGAYSGSGQHAMVLRNLGNFDFEEAGEGFGLPRRGTKALGSAIGDVNNNGRLDIFIADSNRMFLAGDDGEFTEYKRGFFSRHQFRHWPCGAAFADLTGNGLLDLVFTVHGIPAQIFLYVNRGIDENGMPVFEHATAEAGLDLNFEGQEGGIPVRGAHLALVDIDNNGRRDILLSMVYRNEDGLLQPYVLRNEGSENGVPRFSGPSPEKLVGFYATAPVADFDRDGRMDIFMANWHKELDSLLFRNVTESGNYLAVTVKGADAGFNSMGIGAAVSLYEEGGAGDPEKFLSRADITLGNGYSCGEEAVAHFGLGEVEACDVEVLWQGRRRVVEGVPANRRLEVIFGPEG